MKEILRDKRCLFLEGSAALITIIYLILTGSYQHKLIFFCWAASMVLFIAGGIDSVCKRRWILTAVNLAAVILIFISLMFLPYHV